MSTKKKKFRLGLDLDNTALQYTQGLRASTMEMTGLPPEAFAEPDHYSLVESGWPFKTEDDFREAHGWAVEQGIYRNLEAIEGAPEALQAIAEAGVHIHIITSRFVLPRQHAMVLTDTVNNLDALGIPFHGISFEDDKSTITADLYIDDAKHNIIPLREMGRDVLAFGALYNVGVEEPRVDNWEDARDYVLARLEEFNAS